MADLPTDRFAVVDIGSNTVRMVVFDGEDRSLEPVFNEKAMSGLGLGLYETGRLNPEGRESALAVLARFRLIAESLEVAEVRAVATAAARAAEDGATFVAEAATALGHPIRVISGEEEARLSALGVICGAPDADGVIGDLGGGSLEVAEVQAGRVAHAQSLPLGPLALGKSVGGSEEAKILRAGFEAAPEGLAEGRALYVVGGAWRALAKHYFEARHYPIRIIHALDLPAEEAKRFLRRVGRLSPDDGEKLIGVSGRRRQTAPYAARLLRALVVRMRPDRVVFSAYGLREGIRYETMSARMRDADPLLEHCRKLGLGGAREPFDGDRLADWALGAFETPPASNRLVRAAAWLSDISGHDHPDYRGHHAAARALHLASAGVQHSDRVFLAAAVYARYHGFGMERALGRAVDLIDEATTKRAVALGMAFRLAHAIEPGGGRHAAPGLRDKFTLRRVGGSLLLVAHKADPAIVGETARRRLASLARVLEVEHDVVQDQSAAA